MLPAQETPVALRKRALESMGKGKELYQDAKAPSDKVKGYQLYKKGLDMMIKYTKVETNPVIVKKVESALKDLTAKAQEMKAAILPRCKSCNPREKNFVSKKSKKGSRSHSRFTARGPTIQNEKKIKHPNTDPYIQSQVQSTILEPNIRWHDVAGLEKAKIALQESVILPMKFPHLFTGCERPQTKGILLFGAPGTGKTYAAKACAFESQAKFFFVSCSDIISKYVGESEKILRSIFETARANKPAIIFIDSIDSLFSAREENQYHWTKTIKTEFLIQMRNLWQENADVLVLGETNSPWNLDSAVRRKFERRIYFPLPDLAARKSIFLKQFSTMPNTLTQDEIEYVASKTEGYSASDMVVLARDTLYEPLREVQNATHFKEVDTLEDGKPIYQACDPADPGAKKMSMFDLEGPQLRLRDLNMRDCEKALGKMAKRSVLVSELERHEKFMQEYGGEG